MFSIFLSYAAHCPRQVPISAPGLSCRTEHGDEHVGRVGAVLVGRRQGVGAGFSPGRVTHRQLLCCSQTG